MKIYKFVLSIFSESGKEYKDEMFFEAFEDAKENSVRKYDTFISNLGDHVLLTSKYRCEDTGTCIVEVDGVLYSFRIYEHTLIPKLQKKGLSDNSCTERPG